MPPTAATDEPRRSEKWKARRDVIIDTSAPVFARQGYHATGIAELCTVNGLGKGAFYHYIESKEELLAAIPLMKMSAKRFATSCAVTLPSGLSHKYV